MSLAACAGPSASGHPVVPDPHRQERSQALAQARAFLAGAPLVVRDLSFSADPVGFVRAAYWAVGVDLFDGAIAAEAGLDGMAILYRSLAGRAQIHHEQPLPGDLVFFDADERGAQVYPSEVALVEQVAPDGTVSALGVFAAGSERVFLNLRTPDATTRVDGKPANTLLAAESPTPAARLYRAFADPFR